MITDDTGLNNPVHNGFLAGTKDTGKEHYLASGKILSMRGMRRRMVCGQWVMKNGSLGIIHRVQFEGRPYCLGRGTRAGPRMIGAASSNDCGAVSVGIRWHIAPRALRIAAKTEATSAPQQRREVAVAPL